MASLDFTPTESKVLMELMARQREPDREIAARLGMAPSNFAVVKKRLIAKGVLKDFVTLSIGRVPEAKVAAFIWIEYNRPIRERDLSAVEKKALAQLPISHSFCGKDWMLFITYFGSFEDAESTRLGFSEFLQGTMGSRIATYTWRFVPLSHLRI